MLLETSLLGNLVLLLIQAESWYLSRMKNQHGLCLVVLMNQMSVVVGVEQKKRFNVEDNNNNSTQHHQPGSSSVVGVSMCVCVCSSH